MNKLEELEGKIYVFTINSFGFLHTLKLKGLLDEKTDKLTVLLQKLNVLYSQVMELNDDNEKIELLKQVLVIMEQVHNLLMDMHYEEFDLLNEKADLQIDASFIRNDLKEFFNNNENKK